MNRDLQVFCRKLRNQNN